VDDLDSGSCFLPSDVDPSLTRRLLPRLKMRPSKLGNRLVQLLCCVNSRALSRSFCKRRFFFLSVAAVFAVAADVTVPCEQIDLVSTIGDIAWTAVLTTFSVSLCSDVAERAVLALRAEDDFCRVKPNDTASVVVAKILSVSDSNDLVLLSMLLVRPGDNDRANAALEAPVNMSSASGSFRGAMLVSPAVGMTLRRDLLWLLLLRRLPVVMFFVLSFLLSGIKVTVLADAVGVAVGRMCRLE
jgi:hypothetical protein